MTDVTSALDAVGALIGERSKYEGWISALESKRDVPAHVLEKVRGDYTGRLRTVLHAFGAHMPALQTALAEYQTRDAALAAQEQSSRDEHAEGELRHMVGEFDSEQWEKVRVGHEALLSRLASDRQSVATELSGVQRGLSAAVDAGQRARAAGDAAPAASAESYRAASPTPAIEAAMAEPSGAASRRDAVDVTPPAVAAAIGASAPPVFHAPENNVSERRESNGNDDLGFLRPTPRLMPDDEGGVTTQSAPAITVAAPALRIVTDEPASSAPPTPTVASQDVAKTLRCAECGTMNYATEWYCERCGGELAVL
jgi:hypothetical protein